MKGQIGVFIKKHANFIFFIVLITITVAVIAAQVDGKEFVGTLMQTNGWFLAIGLCCVGIYWILEAYMLLKMMRRKFSEEGFRFAMVITIIGQYYNLVTPGASGGQPLQLFEMIRRGYPVGTGTAIIVQKYALYQITVTVLALLSLSINFGTVTTSLVAAKWFITIGLVVNVAGVVLVLIMAFSPKTAREIMTGGVNFLLFCRILKDKEKYYGKIDHFVAEYSQAIDDIRIYKWESLKLLGVSVLQILIFYSINYWVYRALGLHGSTSFTVITMQAILYVAIAFVPTPGAAGGAEAGFALIFGPIYGSVYTSVALILWRIITFYFIIAFGGIFLSFRAILLECFPLKKISEASLKEKEKIDERNYSQSNH
ncbi:lysylphosphatidylglycerol synthase transmembrane domain-containing protein [Eubacterium aggregans]|uniref:lysylphosphatidylglycerol synthase transmembrane domain-containing protein n=2 Tax=Eubacterium aggregans TaxID=81409 RepID=UPI003F39806A